MRERLTARVLLFDKQGRILLMKGRLPHHPPSSAAWFTVGGGVEAGESLTQAAIREIVEETGFTEVELGPVVWTRTGEGVLVSGERVLFKESYIVARCPGGAPSRDGWEDHETDLIDDMRWWTLEELAATADRVVPERFCELVGAVALGRYPEAPLEITVVRIAD